MGQGLPTFADILDAAERLRGQAVCTPVLESASLNERVGGRLLFKAEALQRTGSFKFRGAFNRISRLDDTARRRGVVAYSSGNHAQGVAAAAQILEAPATIVMPADAPAIKIENTRGYGAKIVLYDRYRESREEIGERIAEDEGATLVRPYDDRYIIAGQGTVGLELASQAKALDAALDALLVPSSGGGLIAGTALAVKQTFPDVEAFTVEPEGFDDHARSLAAGKRLTISGDNRSACDALLVPTPGEITFELNRRQLAGGLVVSEVEVARAMREAFLDLKLVLEPSGAVALAAALSGKIDCRNRTVAIVCSGGNADPESYSAALAQAAKG